MKDSLSISDASSATGLSQKQLRDYEAKGFISDPIKIRCGSIQYRRYSPKHIKSIKVFKNYVDQGYTLPVSSQKAFEDQGKGVE